MARVWPIVDVFAVSLFDFVVGGGCECLPFVADRHLVVDIFGVNSSSQNNANYSNAGDDVRKGCHLNDRWGKVSTCFATVQIHGSEMAPAVFRHRSNQDLGIRRDPDTGVCVSSHWWSLGGSDEC